MASRWFAFVDDRAKVVNALLQYAAKDIGLLLKKQIFERFRTDAVTELTAPRHWLLDSLCRFEPSSSTVTPNSQLDLKIKVANHGNQTSERDRVWIGTTDSERVCRSQESLRPNFDLHDLFRAQGRRGTNEK
jgi:hypothetical protein